MTLENCTPEQLKYLRELYVQRLRNARQEKLEEFKQQSLCRKLWLILYWNVKVSYYYHFDKKKYNGLLWLDNITKEHAN